MFPILFSSSTFTLYSYPIFLGLALGVVYYTAFYLFLSTNRKEVIFHKIFWPAVICAWIGAKVFFLLSVKAIQTTDELVWNSSFWLGGGFVFFGGLIFALVYMLIGVWRKWFSISDISLFIPAIAWGHAIGRIGCFLAGCCYGKHSDLIDHIYLHGDFRYPVQLYESASLIVLGFILFKMVKKHYSAWTIIASYIVGYSLLRFGLEFLRGDKIRGLWWGVSTSQIISLIMAIFVASFWIIKHKKLSK